MPRPRSTQPAEHAPKVVRTLARNLAACLEARPELRNDKTLGAAAGVGHGTVQRARAGSNSIQIDNLAAIAKVFGLQPWQMLVPDLDPANPPKLAHLAEQERQMLDRVRRLRMDLESLERE